VGRAARRRVYGESVADLSIAGGAPGAGEAPDAARKRTILGIACLGQFMVILDVSVVTVALPSMRADLGSARPGCSG
jgi:hypothetical protein